MRIRDILLESVPDSRSFGLWLMRLDYTAADKGVYDHDYIDDDEGRPLRYRLIVDKTYLAFVHQTVPQITARGWHLTAETKHGRNRWQLVFEPILTASLPRAGIFWHLTPQNTVAVILRDGLRPAKSRHGFTYPQPRTYLIRNETDAGHMANSFKERDRQPITYSLLRVDLRRAKGVRLHDDPELAKVAVYTTEPIPAALITVAQDQVSTRW